MRETGAEIPFTWDLVKDIWRGSSYILLECFRPRQKPLQKISFAQKPPRAWYLIWGALRQAGLRSDPKAQICLHFSDKTYVPGTDLDDRFHINGHCTDISKSKVAEVFESVFGYGLAIDPASTSGPYLEKGEENGIHDATIETEQKTPEAGRVYQKLLDNRTDNGTVLDYRSPTVFGRIPLIFLKERPLDQRFDNLNTRVRIAKPEDCFSFEELEKIKQFCDAMHLDLSLIHI